MKNHLYRITTIAATSLTLIWSAAAQNTVSPIELIHGSREASGSGQLEEAQQLAQTAVRTDPAYADAWKQLARVQMLRNDPDSALESLKQLENLNPNDAELLSWRLRVLLEAGRTEDAAQIIANLQPEQCKTITETTAALILTTLIKQNEIPSAMVFIDQWCSGTSNADSVAATDVLKHVLMNEPGKATEMLAAIPDAPGKDRPLMALAATRLGMLELQRSRKDAALEAFEKALMARDNKLPTLRDIGGIHLSNGDTERALKTWEKGVSLSEKALPWNCDIAKIYIAQKQPEQALIALRHLLKKEPQNTEAQSLQITALLQKGDAETAAVAYEQLKNQSEAGKAWAELARARVLARQGKHEEATAPLEALLEQTPDSDLLQEMLAARYRAWANDAEGQLRVAVMQRLKALRPTDPSVHRDLAWALWNIDQYDQAVAHFEQAFEHQLALRNKMALQVIASCIETGQKDRAMKLTEKWFPTASPAALGRQLLEVNRAKAALPLLEKAWNEGETNPPMPIYLAYARTVDGVNSPGPEQLAAIANGNLSEASEPEIEMFLKTLDALIAAEDSEQLLNQTAAQLSERPELESRLTDSYLLLARTKKRQRRYADSFRVFSLVLERDANRNCWLEACQVATAADKEADCTALLQDVAARTSIDSIEIAIAGKMAEWNGNTDAAIIAYTTSLELDDLQPELRMTLFRLMVRSGMLQLAESQKQWFADRAEVKRTYAVHLAEMLSVLRKDEEALQHWSALYDSNPDSSHFSVEKARVLFRLGRAAEGHALLLATAEKNQNVQLWQLMAQVEAALGNPEGVLTATEKGLELAESATLLNARSQAAVELGRSEIVQDAGARLLKLQPAHNRIPWMMGSDLVDAGQLVPARELFEGLLERNPDYLPALIRLREIASKERKSREAVNYAKRILDLRPWDQDARLKYAVALAEDEQFNNSLDVLRDMVADDNTAIPVIHYRQPIQFPYSGLNNVDQIAEHINMLTEEAYSFVTPADIDFDNWVNDNKRIMLVVSDTDSTTLKKLDDIVAAKNIKAVYAGPTGLPGRRRPLQPDTNYLDQLAASGRWQIISSGPINSRQLRNLTSRRADKDGTLENNEQVTDRFESLLSKLTAPLPPGPHAMLYPSGNYGQYALDTDSEVLDLLHQGVEHHFNQGIIRDDDGFITANSDPLRLPARRIPAAWDATNVLEHIQRNDPRIDSRLQLAKVLYWFRQHEQANRAFADALAVGADPVQVRYNWGGNAMQQGDLPTALELLRIAAETAPDNERIADTLARAEEQKDPRISLDYNAWSDSEDREFYSWIAAIRGHVSDRVALNAQAEMAQWKEDDIEIDGTRFGGGALWYSSRQIKLSGGLWLLDYDEKDIDDLVGGNIALQLPLTSVGGHITLDARRDEIDTVAAIMEDIQVDRYGIRTYSRWLDNFDLYANFHYSDRTDDNNTLFGDGRFLWRAKEWPYVGVGYYLRLADSDIDPPQYYAPLELQQHQAAVTLRGLWRKKLNYIGSFQAGYVREKGTDWEFIIGGKGRLDYAVTRRINIYGEIYHQESATYDRTGWLGGAVFRF